MTTAFSAPSPLKLRQIFVVAENNLAQLKGLK